MLTHLYQAPIAGATFNRVTMCGAKAPEEVKRHAVTNVSCVDCLLARAQKAVQS